MVTIRRPGRDVTLLADGPPLGACLDVAHEWAGRGVDIEVLDLGAPPGFDEAVVLASVARTKNAVIVGDRAELSCRIHEELFSDLEHAVQRVGADAEPAAIDAAVARVVT